MSDEDKVPACDSIVRCCQFHWKGKFSVIFPLVTLPILIHGLLANAPYKCMYLVVNMGLFWITECIPLYVTALLPIAYLPLFDILDSEKVCSLYFTDTLMMFLGSLLIALAIEYSNLHQRIALRTILIFGCSPRRLHFGFVFVTCFMSLWISNSAATAMMCPIVKGILDEMQAQKIFEVYKSHKEEPVPAGDPPHPSTISMGFYFGVAYAASIGGCGTLIGTSTNLAFKGLYETRFPYAKEKIDFPKFMLYSLPIAVIVNMALVFLALQVTHMGLFRKNSKIGREINLGSAARHAVKKVVKQHQKNLGPMSCHEIQVTIFLILMIVLIFTRKPGFIDGWANVLDAKDIGSSAPVFVCVAILFILPTQYTFFRYCCRKRPFPARTMDACLSWMFVHKNVSWGLCFVLGGGFAIAEGSRASGMAKMMGDKLSVVSMYPNFIVVGNFILISLICTAFSSNVAVCNILVPIFCEASLTITIHPLLLTLPSTLAMSMAYHLPVSTPPNAIVCSYGHIKTKYLIIAGVLPSLSALVCVWGNAMTWGLYVVYPECQSFPPWAKWYNAYGEIINSQQI